MRQQNGTASGKAAISPARPWLVGRLVLLGLLAGLATGASNAGAQVTPIATIQANPAAFDGQVVTVEGQIYIPANYVPTRFSGYIQDGSGRGINLFGNGANNALLFDVGNVVRVTGTLTLFFTTVEIDNITSVTLVSGSNPERQPAVLSTGAAASPSWEGTYIQSGGTISAIGSTAGSAPATNYTVNDGSGNLIIRIINSLGVPTFSVGQSITASGAGAQFQADFQLLVGRASDVELAGDTNPPEIASVTVTAAASVDVRFSEAVTGATAQAAGNYEVFETSTPANMVTVDTAVLATNQTTVSLTLAAPVAPGSYTVRVNNVEDLAGNSIAPNTTRIFTVVGSGPTPIAAIQDDAAAFQDSMVAVEGTIYIRTNYSPFQTSGYIQDGSGRGINLFGTGASNALLQLVGNQVSFMGEVQLSGSTVRLSNLSGITQTGSGPATPIHLPTGAADDPEWEGTFIEVSGTIASSASASGGRNYQVDDGSGAVVVRVESVVSSTVIADGTPITARGAGLAFSSQRVVLVGAASNVFADPVTADTSPPGFLGAWAPASLQEIRLTFSENVGVASAGNAANYTVFETATPANEVPVVAVAVSGPLATLSFTSSLARGTGYTVRVQNVADTATPANVMPAALELAVSTPTGDILPPMLQAATVTSSTSVTVRFSEPIDPVTGQLAVNYEVFETGNEANMVIVSSVSVNGAVVTLTLASSLQAATSYTVRVQDVEDLNGNAIEGAPTTSFTTAPPTTSIADIQANPAAFQGQVVTVEGQVYIAANYLGVRFSGYIQDGSNRGINLFGNGANNAALFDVRNVVRVTGSVTVFNTTVEIETITSVTLVSSGNPELSPRVLSSGAAASTASEGTYIQSGGVISAVAMTAGTAPATNYTVNDGSGNLVIRVSNNLGAPEFSVGQTITAKGAGAQFQSDFQILVGRASDVMASGPDAVPPTISGAAATSDTNVEVIFSEAVTAATAEAAANYAVFVASPPGTTVAVTAAVRATNQTTVSLTLGAALTVGTSYTVRVNNVEDLAGNVIVANSARTFVFLGSGVTPIATIQANPTAFMGMEVTVQGQVYVPANYIPVRFSGYIQDASGRGINLFGSGANNAALFDVRNVVRVTGSVTVFNTTVEIENISSVMLVSGGNPELQPAMLSTREAASTIWEGTYIQSSGVITAIGATGGTAPATNYTVNDGSGALVVRIIDTLGAGPFEVGQTITARGAGSQFQTDFQVLVGRPQDAFLGGGGGTDNVPPRLSQASGTSATRLLVVFSERVTRSSAETVANYAVFETNLPAATVPVTRAELQTGATSVALDVGAPLRNGVSYTVRVSNVADTAGNVIAAASTIAFQFIVFALEGPPHTFLPKLGERYPITFSVPANVQANGEAELRVFDLRGRLRRTLFDSRFSAAFPGLVQWDGRDDALQLLPAGTYIVHLAIVDNTSGNRDALQMPVVIASRLDRR